MTTAASSHMVVPTSKADPRVLRTWRTAAVIAGAFCVVVCGAIVVEHFRLGVDNPLKSPQVKALKEKLLAVPEDEPLKQQIRALDLQLRQRYFHQLSLNNAGAWLALAGALMFLLAAKREMALRKTPPMPMPKQLDAAKTARELAVARGAVAAVGALVAASFVVVGVSVRTSVPARQADVEKLFKAGAAGAAPVVDAATPAEMIANWPSFRGADGSGFTKTDGPLNWDTKTGAGILWKSPVPAQGFNSPIAWQNRVFLCGGDAAKREVFCFDAANGQLLWRRAIENVPGAPAQVPEVPEQCGYAAPTMATDGRRVYAIFASGELAALTLDGQPVWSKHFGALKNAYGHATSLAMWQGKVLVQLDQGDSPQSGSKLYAFDGATGKIAWEQRRPVPASWASPVVVEAAGKPQVITISVPWAIAYAANDGTELWRAGEFDGEITPSPIAAGEFILLISPSNKMAAVKPDGAGDVSKTHEKWAAEDSIPDVTSPVSNGELVFVVNTGGMLTCYDVKDGKKVWEHDLNMEVQSSPGIAGNKLYIFGTKGAAVVLEAGRAFKQLARTEMDDKFFASPAFAGGKMFMRGLKHLYCIGEKGAATAKQ
ncbi:MAG: PQQ-binding-like beta-propeller repeat protein [Verrucomicrobia bacterium]|nr:PQQ-binding-like beta-propeller repeat protein [Verrucomicrobiota bacterium]